MPFYSKLTKNTVLADQQGRWDQLGLGLQRQG